MLLGTTSESPTLNEYEKKEIVKFTHDFVDNRKNIIVGVGGNNTTATIDFAKYCFDYCTGFMVTVPNYNKPTQDGIYQHFYAICQNSELKEKPVIMYNIPSRCGVNMLPETVVRIAHDCPNVLAIKEASGSIDQAMRIKELCDIKIFSGDDALILPIMSIGGSGVISVASNIIPKYICNIVDSCLDDNYLDARKMFYKAYKFIKMLFIETNPSPIKYILYRISLINNDIMRLPLCKMQDDNKNNLFSSFLECFNNEDEKIFKAMTH